MICNLRCPASKLPWPGQEAYLHISLTPAVDGTRHQKSHHKRTPLIGYKKIFQKIAFKITEMREDVQK